MREAKLNVDLLMDDKDYSQLNSYSSCLNARGLYHSQQFVLRLRPDLHHAIDSLAANDKETAEVDFETTQALSTLFHETIHWWQHVGSVTGLISSLCYPAQTHINASYLNDYLNLTGPIKPILKYNERNATEFKPTDEEFRTINVILNNFFDIENYKARVITPNNMEQVAATTFFESTGHSFNVTYTAVIQLLSSCFDPTLTFLPNAQSWGAMFDQLNQDKVEDFYHGSKITVPQVGLIDLYEGQARFSQLQYLYFSTGKTLSWEDFDAIGMLSGVYYSAFNVFLTALQEDRPPTIDSPLIALYLLVIDLAINPTEGFPFDIEYFDLFVSSTDPGIRFHELCHVIANKLPHLKFAIQTYSAEEYFEVTSLLSLEIGSKSPLEMADLIDGWMKNQNALQVLMKEESDFSFSDENLPIRLIFSQFLKMQINKKNNPEFFCWPGRYTTLPFINDRYRDLYVQHQALFKDKVDGDIYPAIIPGKTEESIMNVFNNFYAWIAAYDLCRQWIISDGDFEFDYFWLTSKYSMKDMAAWGENSFQMMFDKKTSEFQILD